MRVLVSDPNELFVCVEATCVEVANKLVLDDDSRCDDIKCPCLHIHSNSQYEDIYIIMSPSSARGFATQVYANGVLDLSSYYNTTFYDPDDSDVQRIKEALVKLEAYLK